MIYLLVLKRLIVGQINGLLLIFWGIEIANYLGAFFYMLNSGYAHSIKP